jgi:protein-tyrosine phosphatase
MAWAYRAGADQLRRVSYAQRGTDLLLETPYGYLPPAFEGVIRELRGRGFRILLAHPERSPTFQHEPGRLGALLHDGVLVQVGADALTDLPRRSRTRRLATRLVSERLAHVLASDSHGPGVGRSPKLSPAANAADRLAPGRGAWMVTDAPAAVLAGEPLPAAPARRQAVLGGRGSRRRAGVSG